MNKSLKHAFSKDVIWISTKMLNDECGNLIKEYTTDGLHLSEHGYMVLEKLVAEALRRDK